MKSVLISLCITALLIFSISGCNNSDNIVEPSVSYSPDNIGSTWYVPGDFATIQEAIYAPAVQNGDIIMVGDGNFAGAYVTKGISIIGGDNTVINDGPLHPAGWKMGFRLLAGSDGAVISNLTFTVDLAIMNGDAVDNVTVSQCKFLNSVQAISNWRGSGWNINHNNITDLRCRNGGGIGILVADYSGGTVENNIISHNTISGTLHVDPLDLGGYSGSGIVMYADFRWGRLGADEIKNNYVIHNKVTLTSDNASVVDVWAFELTDTREVIPENIIFENSIGFNDFRGTVNQIALSPDELDNLNYISKNLGDNRGHGLHPKDFNPGN